MSTDLSLELRADLLRVRVAAQEAQLRGIEEVLRHFFAASTTERRGVSSDTIAKAVLAAVERF